MHALVFNKGNHVRKGIIQKHADFVGEPRREGQLFPQMGQALGRGGDGIPLLLQEKTYLRPGQLPLNGRHAVYVNQPHALLVSQGHGADALFHQKGVDFLQGVFRLLPRFPAIGKQAAALMPGQSRRAMTHDAFFKRTRH